MKNGLLQFNKAYFLWATAIFIVEIIIAKFAHDQIIRPYIGDVLVVMLIYCFIKSFLNTPVLSTAIATLIFAYLIEALQYMHIVNKLGLQDYQIARTVIGTSAEWTDIVAYTCGIAIILYLEKITKKTTK